MKEAEQNRSANGGLSFSVPLLIFVLLFVLSSAVLVGVFARAASISQQAEALNDGVQLCRNAAEVYRSTGDLRQTAALLGGEPGSTQLAYDKELCLTTEAGAVYLLTLSQRVDGDLHAGTFTVCTAGGDEVFTLTEELFLPEVGQ